MKIARMEDQGASAVQDKAIDAGKTDRMSAAEARPTPSPCREDGRCQYAIDHGAEGMAACPVGKCAHMDSAEPAEG